jgi:hypothetical protein
VTVIVRNTMEILISRFRSRFSKNGILVITVPRNVILASDLVYPRWKIKEYEGY